MADTQNALVAERLRELATLLQQQGANPFRVSAYRRAADTVAGLEEDVAALVERGGADGLTDLPGIGRSIAAAIEEMVRTGRWSQLDRLRGTLEPEKVFRAIPGVGPKLARRIHDALQVDTLEAVEAAAHDGRLAAVPGIGARRAAMIRSALAARRARRPARPPAGAPRPDVGLILAVDEEYRREAAAGRLRRIAPRRFNPSGEAWLSVLHAERDGWDFTALYSNTARAHELDRIGDWVVIYYHSDHKPEGQCTVVTETRGPLAGRRVVRGREDECRAQYRSGAPAAAAARTAHGG
jgi:putative hydrolase